MGASGANYEVGVEPDSDLSDGTSRAAGSFEGAGSAGRGYFEDFAAGREHAAAGSLVGVHGLHEFDFLRRVVSFARGRVDLPAPRHLETFSQTPLDGDGHVLLAAVFRIAAILRAAIHGNLQFSRCTTPKPSTLKSFAVSRVALDARLTRVRSARGYVKIHHSGKIFGYAKFCRQNEDWRLPKIPVVSGRLPERQLVRWFQVFVTRTVRPSRYRGTQERTVSDGGLIRLVAADDIHDGVEGGVHGGGQRPQVAGQAIDRFQPAIGGVPVPLPHALGEFGRIISVGESARVSERHREGGPRGRSEGNAQSPDGTARRRVLPS